LESYQMLNRPPGVALSQKLVSHSMEVILAAQSLRSALQDAERVDRE